MNILKTHRILAALLVSLAVTSFSHASEKRTYMNDSARLVQLMEESKSRTLEVGYIVARHIGVDLSRIDNISTPVNTSAAAGDQIVEYWLNGELVAVGCHDESAQESYPGPCDD